MATQPASARDWLIHQAFGPFVEPGQLPFLWMKRIISPEVEQPQREVDLSLPSISGVNNERIYKSAPLCELITDPGGQAVLIVGLKTLRY